VLKNRNFENFKIKKTQFLIFIHSYIKLYLI